MGGNSKHRKGFKERKARNRRLLDESRKVEINKKNNIIRMIQEQMKAQAEKQKIEGTVPTEEGKVIKIVSTSNGEMHYVEDEETKTLNNSISTPDA